jgi:hypothetical protein
MFFLLFIHCWVIQHYFHPSFREQSCLNEWGLPKGKMIAYVGEMSGFSGIDSDEYGWDVTDKEE